MTLLVATVSASIAVPRPETPHSVPYPPVDWEAAAEVQRTSTQLAQAAVRDGLPVEVRGVGERIRRCGQFESRGQTDRYVAERTVLRRVVRELMTEGRQQELLALRHVQAALLAIEIERLISIPQEASGMVDELGGSLWQHLRAERRWLFADETWRPMLLAMFNQRWSSLVGLEEHPMFGPSANEWRLVHRFRVLRLLKRPSFDGPALLRALKAVASYSPDYPRDYALGIVLYRMGAFAEAMDAFSRHLQQHPDGEWALRAQNFRLGAASALVE